MELIDNDEIGRMAAIAYRIVSQTGEILVLNYATMLGLSHKF